MILYRIPLFVFALIALLAEAGVAFAVAGR